MVQSLHSFLDENIQYLKDNGLYNEIDTVDVTVSIGVGYKETANGTKRDLVKNAESALFEAKKLGQNRVMFAPIG